MQKEHSLATTRKHACSGWQRYLAHSCCILFFFFLSCSHSLATGSTILPLPNILQIQLQTPRPGPIITVNDASLVRHLYLKMYLLPPYPQGRTCEELRQGDVYTLTFYRNRNVITHASVEKNGCHGLTLSELDTRKPDQAFWNLFQQALYSDMSFASTTHSSSLR